MRKLIYGSFESSVNPSTDSDHHNVEYTSLRIVKFAIHEGLQKPRMSKSRFQFAVH
jgi:hypothetical protein